MSVKFLTDNDEKAFVKTINGKKPDENGNVNVAGGSGGGSGEPGADGFSPIATVTQTASGAVISVTDKSGTTTATIANGKDGKDGVDGQPGKDGSPGADGYTPVKGKDYFDGEDGQDGSPGKDGVSATHSWNGTTLTITSASGTSSANLKGEKGDKGDSVKGDKGDTGAAGVSVSSVKQTTTSSADGGSNVVTVTLSNGTASTFTVKNGSKGLPGTDYVLTDADREEILAEVRATSNQQTPLFANSTDECTDTTKVYVLPDGYIYAYSAEAGETSPNLNDGVYEYGRFASNGTEYDGDSPITGAFRSANYLEVEGGRTIKGYFDHNIIGNYAIDIVQYDSEKSILVKRTAINNLIHEGSATTELVLNANTKYIRFDINSNGTKNYDLSAVKVAIYYKEDAVAEFIEYTGQSKGGWMSTGLAFIPADYEDRIIALENRIEQTTSILKGKKIIYDGDSICYGAGYTGGYAKMIAEKTGGYYINQAVGGGYLRSASALGKTNHSVVDNLANLPTDGDLYCFEGGINDYWGNATLGTYTLNDFTGELDTTTICGALEAIFRYGLNNFQGKPICFVITHKIQNSAYIKNSAGNTYKEYRDVMAGICEKYSIPYYDAFSESGLNGWNAVQNGLYLTGNANNEPDGCHPNAEGYKRYYVPQLISLFERIMPVE